MTRRWPELFEAVETLSDAVETALPHMRAVVAPLAAPGLDPDTLVEAFIESLLFGAVWIRPPYTPIEFAESFLEDVIAEYGEAEVFPALQDSNGASLRNTLFRYEDYAAFVRGMIWRAS